MKLSLKLFALLLPIVMLTTQAIATEPAGPTAKVTEPTTESNQSTTRTREDTVYSVEFKTLKSIANLALRKRWDPANAHLEVYRNITSCPHAAEAISSMLIKKNRDGAVAVVKLVQYELIKPEKSPITSTKDVKRIFFDVIKKTKRQEVKKELINTFLTIFPLNSLTPSEKAAIENLKTVVEAGLLRTAAIIENIYIKLIEEVGHPSPLDFQPTSAPETS